MTTPAQPADLLTWLRWVLDQREAEAKLLCQLAGVTDTYPDWLRTLLAEVDAKRRILDAAEGAFVYAEGDRSSEVGWADESTYRWILAVLALPYADRPGYREEWRPA